jgi:3-hydroxyisobutyrate dehydrogenase
VIGIGAMGMPIAKNLHRKGFSVAVRDIRSLAHEEAIAFGMPAFDSPALLAKTATHLIVVVVNVAQIREALFGEHGVTSIRGPVRTVLLCSTIAPQDTVDVANRLADFGIRAIDAPISGGPERASQGTMSMMLAGDTQTIADCEDVLAAMSDKRFLISEVIGDGARMKLVNNLLAGINLVGSAEAFALGTRLGLDPACIYEVITASSGASWVFEDRMARVLRDDFKPRAFAHILEKDVGLAVAMAQEAGSATPLGESALARFRQMLLQGMGQLDDAAVVKTYLQGIDADPLGDKTPSGDRDNTTDRQSP